MTQAHRPTAAEMRVTFGFAVKCTSAARWDTSFLARRKGCVSPTARGPVLNRPANVSACSISESTQLPLTLNTTGHLSPKLVRSFHKSPVDLRLCTNCTQIWFGCQSRYLELTVILHVMKSICSDLGCYGMSKTFLKF